MSNDTTNPDDSTDTDLEARIEELEAREQLMRERMNRAFELIEEQAEEIEEYEGDRERLVFRVGKLEACLPTDEDDYETLSRDDKVAMVRAHIMERAYARGGKASLDYNDVQWSVFDGEPSPDHCYKLMKLAAAGEDGFDYHEEKRPKQLRVNLDATKAIEEFSHANKTESEGGR